MENFCLVISHITKTPKFANACQFVWKLKIPRSSLVYDVCGIKVHIAGFRNMSLKADFHSVRFSERAEIPLFARENVALKLNR